MSRHNGEAQLNYSMDQSVEEPFRKHGEKHMAKHVWTEQTNKRTFILMSVTGTQETSVCLHLVKLYKILLRFAVRAIVSEIE